MSRKHLLWILGLIVAAIVIVGGFSLRGPFAYASIATAYAAQQTCACIHVSGRTLDSCVADFPPEARANITVVQDADNHVQASALGLFKADASYDEAFGCTLD